MAPKTPPSTDGSTPSADGSTPSIDGAGSGGRRWDFLTNHAHVLVCISGDPGARLRDIAEKVGITERATHRIVTELVATGYVGKQRDGRRNRYTIETELPLRHPLTSDRRIGELIRILAPAQSG